MISWFLYTAPVPHFFFYYYYLQVKFVNLVYKRISHVVCLHNSDTNSNVISKCGKLSIFRTRHNLN